jgi:hypothetical protein
MFRTNRSLMGSQQPPFQKARDTVTGRQQILTDLRGATNHDVPISLRFQLIVAAPAVSPDLAPRYDHAFQGWNQRSSGGVGNMTHTDPPDLLTRLKLDRQQHQGLPLCSPTPFPRLFAAHIALVGFHETGQAITSRTHHGPPQLLQPCPRRLVTTQPQESLDRQSAGPVLLVGDLPHRPKPQRQGKSAAIKDRSRRHGRLPPTPPAKPQPTAHPPRARATTSGTAKAIRPSQSLQILPARLFCRKSSLKLHQRPRIRFHIRLDYPLWLVESNGYPNYQLPSPNDQSDPNDRMPIVFVTWCLGGSASDSGQA